METLAQKIPMASVLGEFLSNTIIPLRSVDKVAGCFFALLVCIFVCKLLGGNYSPFTSVLFITIPVSHIGRLS